MTAIQKLTVSHENLIANLEILKTSRADFELESFTILENYRAGDTIILSCYSNRLQFASFGHH
nr:hypothetical protein [Nostoc sp. EkiNYC01]